VDEQAVWKLRAWDDQGVQDDFLAGGFVAVGSDDIPVDDAPSDDVLRERLYGAHPDRSDAAIGTFVRYWRSFLTDMEPGDLVMLSLLDRRVAVGRVLGSFRYVPDAPEPRTRCRRPVEWISGPFDRSTLPADLRRVANAPGTIGRVRADDAARRLLAVVLAEC
jgi:predicted Mrr-cat superfamily restriction endonuclease